MVRIVGTVALRPPCADQPQIPEFQPSCGRSAGAS
jgi:hypothetical protein